MIRSEFHDKNRGAIVLKHKAQQCLRHEATSEGGDEGFTEWQNSQKGDELMDGRGEHVWGGTAQGTWSSDKQEHLLKWLKCVKGAKLRWFSIWSRLGTDPEQTTEHT